MIFKPQELLDLQGHESFLGLPTFPTNIYHPGKPYIHGLRRHCQEAGQMQYYVTGDCSGTQYEWEVLGSTATIAATANDTVWIDSTQAGSYCLVVHKFGPCRTLTDTLCVAVEDCCFDAITADFQVADTVFQMQDSIDIINTSTGAVSYFWSLNGMPVSTAQDWHFVPDTAGMYAVQLTAVGSDTACKAVKNLALEVRCKANSAFTTIPEFPQPGEPVAFIAPMQDVQGTALYWYINDSLVSTANSFITTFLYDKSYDVHLDVTHPLCNSSTTRSFGWGACHSGNAHNIWRFYYHQMTFPVSATAAQVQVVTDSNPQPWALEGSTGMCDAHGQLLWYADGVHVYNRLNAVMASDTTVLKGLGGTDQASQMIGLPLPGSDSLYYLIYPEGWRFTFWGTHKVDTIKNMYYAIIDMSAEGGLGRVVQKQLLLHDRACDKVAATRHCNGRDWWVVTHQYGSNRFLAWLLDSTGLATVPIISDVGKEDDYAWSGGPSGQLAFSPDGSRLAAAMKNEINHNVSWPNIETSWPHNDWLEVFTFDNASGIVSDPMLLADSLFACYGAAFSPDGSKLYATLSAEETTKEQHELWQFDISSDYDTTILATFSANISNYFSATGLQVGPDERIYHIHNKNINVIHHPNRKGLSCDFEQSVIRTEKFLGKTLPTFPANYYSLYRSYIRGPRQWEYCTDSQKYYVSGDCSGAQYEWEVVGSGANIVTLTNDTVLLSIADTGTYYIIAHKHGACRKSSDTMRIQVSPCTCRPAFQWIEADTVVCAGQLPWMQYSTDAQEVWLENSSSGNMWQLENSVYAFTAPAADSSYILHLFNGPYCDTSITFSVYVHPRQEFAWQQLDSIVCFGDHAVIDFTTTATLVELINDSTDHIRTNSVLPISIGPIYRDSCYTLRLRTPDMDCDTFVHFCVGLTYPDTTHVDTATCMPQDTGLFVSILQNQRGCDSVVFIQVGLLPSSRTDVFLTTCDSAMAGIDTVVLSNHYGCDSVVVTETVALPQTKVCGTVFSCDSTQIGFDTLVLMNQYGCDSVVITETKALPHAKTNVVLYSCDSTQIGLDTVVLTNQYGCDSVVITETQGLPHAKVYGTVFSCDSAQVGFDTVVLSNQYGCDSVVITENTGTAAL